MSFAKEQDLRLKYEYIDEEAINKKVTKKKKKKRKKSDHKHLYESCYYVFEKPPFGAKYTTGSCCSVCGRIKNMRILMDANVEARIKDKVEEDRADKPVVYIPKEWDFMDKYVPLPIKEVTND